MRPIQRWVNAQPIHTAQGAGAGEIRSPVKSAAADIKGSPVVKRASPYSKGGLFSLRVELNLLCVLSL